MDSISEEYAVAQPAAGSAGSELVVSVRGLVKRHGSHEAVAGIDLEVRRGEIFAFLGPNGAGKTTTVEILAGFQQRTAGQVLPPRTASRPRPVRKRDSSCISFEPGVRSDLTQLSAR